MPIVIELPERLAGALENRARKLHSSAEAIAIAAIEKDLATTGDESAHSRRVRLPLIRSAKPGSLRSMTNAEIDDIIGG